MALFGGKDGDIVVNDVLHAFDGTELSIDNNGALIDGIAAFLWRRKVVPVLAFLPAHLHELLTMFAK